MKRIILVFLCLSAFYAKADLNINASNVQENYSETVKVSGKFHMGIQFSGKHDFDSLYVDLPANSEGMLCIRMASINGIYKANLNHFIAKKTSGRTKVNFDSQFKNKISSLKRNELSLLTTIGESCNAPNARILMSSWSEDTINLTPILIIRSGARIDIAHIPNIKKSKKSFKCKKFEGPNTVTFDKYCELNINTLAELNSVEIYRKNLRVLPPKKIVISI